MGKGVDARDSHERIRPVGTVAALGLVAERKPAAFPWTLFER